jgi:hypothetical protein
MIKKMKKIVLFTTLSLILLVPLIVASGRNSEDISPRQSSQENLDENDQAMKDTIGITVGGRVFKATLEGNVAATAFKSMLPLTINMKDLNSNEKFFDFSTSLPANASNPHTISSGDLMLWGSNTLVLFYKTFNTSYSYTRLGRIENPSGLVQALGSGNVTVTFDLFSK